MGIDRAGIVGEYGETHQGLFDVPFLTIPNVTYIHLMDMKKWNYAWIKLFMRI